MELNILAYLNITFTCCVKQLIFIIFWVSILHLLLKKHKLEVSRGSIFKLFLLYVLFYFFNSYGKFANYHIYLIYISCENDWTYLFCKSFRLGNWWIAKITIIICWKLLEKVCCGLKILAQVIDHCV